MARDLVKRFVTKDGTERVNIYRDEFADNPRDMTDEPLHCEDWLHNYSIMNKQERENKSENACQLLKYFIAKYGDWKKIIDFLAENGKNMTDGRSEGTNALVYNKSEHRWELWTMGLHYNYHTRSNEKDWYLDDFYYEKKYNIDLYGLVEELNNDTIEYIAQNFLGDKVKIASYSFGYYGEISFDDYFDCESEGICWLEKDEFLKYSGCSEDYWNGKTLMEIEWLCDELEAWGDNEVYGFEVEEAVMFQTKRVCLSGNAADEEYDETEWNVMDSCWGFYGELDKRIEDILSMAGFKVEEVEVSI